MISLAAVEAERIVAVPLAFKNKLRIEDKAYRWLRSRERLHDLLLTGSGAGAGVAAASSATVAGTFFAPTGLMAWLGLATATTPIGWVLAAAVATGGTALALGKLLSRKSSLAAVVPHHINTPIDLLAQSMMELVGGLAVRVATVDGEFHEDELRIIGEVLHGEWGYDRDYVASSIALLVTQVSETTVHDLTDRLQQFLHANPDCNVAEMNRDLLEFVREIVGADGFIRPEELAALDDIEAAIAGKKRLETRQSSTTG